MREVAPVSVVMPCYRCTRTLARAVASVAAQTLPVHELILVDDGSADGTRALMQDLCAQYPPGWIRLVLLGANGGAASARNAGWAQAAGDFVAFLDADDSWHPRKVEVQYGFMAARPDIAVSGHAHVQVAGVPTPMPEVGAVFHRLHTLYVVLKNPFVTPSFMVRRDLPIRFVPGRRHMEDHYFLMQVAMAGLGIAKADVPLAFIYKSIFGEAGLSADLWSMQRSELENYTQLGRAGDVWPLTALLLKGYSWLKFFRRVLIVAMRRKFKQ